MRALNNAHLRSLFSLPQPSPGRTSGSGAGAARDASHAGFFGRVRVGWTGLLLATMLGACNATNMVGTPPPADTPPPEYVVDIRPASTPLEAAQRGSVPRIKRPELSVEAAREELRELIRIAQSLQGPPVTTVPAQDNRVDRIGNAIRALIGGGALVTLVYTPVSDEDQELIILALQSLKDPAELLAAMTRAGPYEQLHASMAPSFSLEGEGPPGYQEQLEELRYRSLTDISPGDYPRLAQTLQVLAQAQRFPGKVDLLVNAALFDKLTPDFVEAGKRKLVSFGRMFMFHPDKTGNRVVDEMLAAANQGAKFSLVVDEYGLCCYMNDNERSYAIQLLNKLSAHPNIEVLVHPVPDVAPPWLPGGVCPSPGKKVGPRIVDGTVFQPDESFGEAGPRYIKMPTGQDHAKMVFINGHVYVQGGNYGDWYVLDAFWLDQATRVSGNTAAVAARQLRDNRAWLAEFYRKNPGYLASKVALGGLRAGPKEVFDDIKIEELTDQVEPADPNDPATVLIPTAGERQDDNQRIAMALLARAATTSYTLHVPYYGDSTLNAMLVQAAKRLGAFPDGRPRVVVVLPQTDPQEITRVVYRMFVDELLAAGVGVVYTTDQGEYRMAHFKAAMSDPPQDCARPGEACVGTATFTGSANGHHRSTNNAEVSVVVMDQDYSAHVYDRLFQRIMKQQAEPSQVEPPAWYEWLLFGPLKRVAEHAG